MTRLPLTIADVVVALAFVGVVLQLLSRRLRGVRLPPVQAFALVAVAVVALFRTDEKAEAAREVLQLVEYFLVAFAVFGIGTALAYWLAFFPPATYRQRLERVARAGA